MRSLIEARKKTMSLSLSDIARKCSNAIINEIERRIAANELDGDLDLTSIIEPFLAEATEKTLAGEIADLKRTEPESPLSSIIKTDAAKCYANVSGVIGNLRATGGGKEDEEEFRRIFAYWFEQTLASVKAALVASGAPQAAPVVARPAGPPKQAYRGKDGKMMEVGRFLVGDPQEFGVPLFDMATLTANGREYVVMEQGRFNEFCQNLVDEERKAAAMAEVEEAAGGVVERLKKVKKKNG